MWTRKELKQRGMNCFRLNYWKTVLIALIAVCLAGGMNGVAAVSGSSGSVAGSSFGVMHEQVEEESQLPEEIAPFAEDGNDIGLIVLLIAVFMIVFLVVLAVAFLISAFLLNPLEVGTKRFFLANLHMPAEVREVAFGYDHCYRNIVKILFFRDLFLFLWGLLFVIPGVVKAYEYRMIPYLLAEHPEMTRQEVFAASKAMMRGQKWRAFILDLSFLGWEILSVFTLGLLEVFYVSPYRSMTNAALYEALAYGSGQDNVQEVNPA